MYHAVIENGIQNDNRCRHETSFYDTSTNLDDQLVRVSETGSCGEEVPKRGRSDDHISDDCTNEPDQSGRLQFVVASAVLNIW